MPIIADNASWMHELRKNLLQKHEAFNHNDTHVEDQRKRLFRMEVIITFLVLYSIMSIISAFGNFLVCYVILKNKRLHTATNFLIANLAVSDLLITFINVPLNMARNFMGEWPFGEIPCHMMNFTLVLTTYVSTYTLTSIALDRHRVVLKPLSRRMSRRFALVILTLVWLVSLCLSLPYGLYMRVVKMRFIITKEVYRCRFVGPGYWSHFEEFLTVTTFLLKYLLPFSVIAVTYGRIVQSLWARTQVGAVTANQHLSRMRAKKKSIKLLIAVVVVFALCWLPLSMYHLLTNFHPDPEKVSYDSVVFFICHLIAISSTCFNPFVYCWLNENFREEVKSRFYWFYVPCRRRRKMRSSMDAEITLLDGDGRNQRVPSSRLEDATSGACAVGGAARGENGRYPSVRKDPTTTSSDLLLHDTVNIGSDQISEIDLLPNFHSNVNGSGHQLYHLHNRRNQQISSWSNKSDHKRRPGQKTKSQQLKETKRDSREENSVMEDIEGNEMKELAVKATSNRDTAEIPKDAEANKSITNKQNKDMSSERHTEGAQNKENIFHETNTSLDNTEKVIDDITCEAEESLMFELGCNGRGTVVYQNLAKQNIVPSPRVID